MAARQTLNLSVPLLLLVVKTGPQIVRCPYLDPTVYLPGVGTKSNHTSAVDFMLDKFYDAGLNHIYDVTRLLWT